VNDPVSRSRSPGHRVCSTVDVHDLIRCDETDRSGCRRTANGLPALILLLAALAVPRDTSAYSVFAHEANIDALWDTGIGPVLELRYPRATREERREARAYAYGGSVIQDLGY
jgi:hypothetical protein